MPEQSEPHIMLVHSDKSIEPLAVYFVVNLCSQKGIAARILGPGHYCPSMCQPFQGGCHGPNRTFKALRERWVKRSCAQLIMEHE